MSYTQTQIKSIHSLKKKKEILSFTTTWIDLEGIMLNKMSQTEKDKVKQTRQNGINYMWNCFLKNQTYRNNKKNSGC